jgi:hypothetical protein
MKITVFWDVAQCSVLEIDVSDVFTASIITAIMTEPVSTSETLVNFY